MRPFRTSTAWRHPARGAPGRRARPARRRSSPRVTSGRLLLGGLSLAAAACASAGAPEPAGAPVALGTRAPVERLLDHSAVESIVTGRAGEFTRQVAISVGDVTDAELERLVPAVSAAFAPDRLRADVAAFVESEAPPGRIEEVLGWLEGGANAELGAIAGDYEPPLSMREFVRELVERGPSEERLGVMRRWAEVQGTQSFYVLLEQALAEAVNTVTRELRPATPPFRPLSGEALFERLDASLEAAVVTFLYRLEPVPDDVIRRATEEYATESGQWYAATYSLAVAEAIRTAAGRVVRSLEEPGEGGTASGGD